MKKLLISSIFVVGLSAQSFPWVSGITPGSGSGSSVSLTVTSIFTNPITNGQYVWLRVGETTHGCNVLFQIQSSVISILDDNSTAWGAGPMGGQGTQSNTQCNFANSSVSQSFFGNQHTGHITFNFNAAFAGSHQIWAQAYSVDGTVSSWFSSGGSWTVPGTVAAPSIISVSPATGTGATQSFQITGTDNAGYGNIVYLWLRFGGTINGCNLLFDRAAAKVSMLSDDGTVWGPWSSLGGGGIIQGPRCSFPLNSTSQSLSGNSMTAAGTLTFSPSFPGALSVNGIIYSQSLNSGWVQFGTWTNPIAFGDVSSIDTGISATLQDDLTGNMYQNPTSINPWSVHLKNGRTVTVKSHGKFNLAKLEYSHEPVGDAFAYHFTVDTRQVWGFRIGDTEDTFWLDSGLKPVDVQPNSPHGWTGGPFAWHNLDSKGKSESSEFSLTSKWRPGPISMYLVDESAKEPVPVFPDTESNQRVHSVANIFDNSLKKFVIGPAIKPDITNDEMQILLGRWVEDYGFAFLQPLREGKTLADLEPNGDFETEIVHCLRNVTPKDN